MSRERARLLLERGAAPLRRGALALAIGVVLANPALAFACPVCFNAKDDAARVAFLGTTVFLTALPLLLIGGIIMWLAKRAAAADHEVAPPEPPAETDPAAPDVTGARPIPTRP